MLEWLLNLVGIGETLLARLHEAEWVIARPMLFWFGLVLLVPAAVLIARRHRASLGHLSRLQRSTLTACRVGVLAVLVFVLGAPYLRLEDEVERKPIVAVLVDDSASMDLPAGEYPPDQQTALARIVGVVEREGEGEVDGDAEAVETLDAAARRELSRLTRRELVRRVLSSHEKEMIGSLDERFDLRFYRFAGGVEPIALAALIEDETREDEANRSLARESTALGEAIAKVLDEVGPRQLAGLVVISDGQTNVGPEPAEVVAARLGNVVRASGDVGATDGAVRRGAAGGGWDGAGTGRAGVVWAVPAGSPEPLEDVAVAEAVAPARVAPGDSVSVTARLISHGFAGQSVRVMLREGGEVVDERRVHLAEGLSEPVELNFVTVDPGARLLEVAVEPPEGDRVPGNDALPVSVTVDGERWRVLYIDGYPRWDFRFLDHSLRRSRGLDVTMVLESEFAAPGRNESEPGAEERASSEREPAVGASATVSVRPAEAAGLPQSAEALAEYDVVMLGDVSPRFADGRFLEQLKVAVRSEIVGLVIQAGPRHMPAHFAGGALDELLPVELAGAESGDMTVGVITGMEAEAYAPFAMALTSAGAVHSAFSLYDRASRNQELWGRMPRFYWAADSGEPKAGATVLAERYTGDDVNIASDRAPLIVEHFAGAGRVLFVGIDTTYRWRRNVGDHLFDHFWLQALRHAASPRRRADQGGWLEVNPAHAAPGEAVRVEVYRSDGESDGARLDVDRVTVHVRVAGGGGEKTIEPIMLERADASGHYRGQWTPPGEGDYELELGDVGEGGSIARLRVAGARVELGHVAIDRDLLGELAERGGGGLLELAEIQRLGELLEGEPVTVHTVYEQEIWDNWLVLAILVCLYCTDVLVRRLAGMT